MGVFTHSNSKKTTQMKKTQCILVAALLLLAACAPKEGEFAEPRFRKVEHRDFTILGEELMLSVVGGEAAWRDHLILLSDDMATRNNIHIYSKRTGAWELSALPTGRAAGEITLATDIQVMGDTLYVFDNNPPRLKKYLLPALLAQGPMSEVFLGEIPMSDRSMTWAGAPGTTFSIASSVIFTSMDFRSALLKSMRRAYSLTRSTFVSSMRSNASIPLARRPAALIRGPRR